MTRLALTLAISVAAVAISFAAGRSLQPNLPATPYHYAWPQLPARFSGYEKLTAADPAFSDAGAALGRVLFYDHGLSANGLVACASCHSQNHSFDDANRFSIGLRGKITRRSAMSLADAAINPAGRYFHDQRATSLQAQVLMPFVDPIEMGLKPGEVIERVASRSWYRPLFAAAFGDEEISEARIASALAQFVSAMVSVDLRYDEARAQAKDALEPFAAFGAEENRGKFLFLAKRQQGGAGCAACHESEWFALSGPHDNGLAPIAGHSDHGPDGGVGEITGNASEIGLFRAPSLRNVAVSPPYMHDGRFKTLAEVIDHYSTGIAATPNLDPLLRDDAGAPVRLDLSEDDKRALEAFLRTLTDEKFLTDPRFSDPFATQ